MYFLDPVGPSLTEDSNNVTKADAGTFSEICIFCVIFALYGCHNLAYVTLLSLEHVCLFYTASNEVTKQWLYK